MYVEKVNFILPAGALFMVTLDVSALSFTVSFVEVPECYLNIGSMDHYTDWEYYS